VEQQLAAFESCQYRVVLTVFILLWLTHAAQDGTHLSPLGICRFISYILHNQNLTKLSFGTGRKWDPTPIIRSKAWCLAGLPVPPGNVSRQDWGGVLCFLRAKVRCFCAQKQNLQRRLQFPSPSSQLHQATSLVLSAAAACPIFDRRSSRAHSMQPPAFICISPSQRVHDRVSPQLCCHGSQRLQLLPCCCLLANVAVRAVRLVHRHERHRSLQMKAVGLIMKRVLSNFAWRVWSSAPATTAQLCRYDEQRCANPKCGYRHENTRGDCRYGAQCTFARVGKCVLSHQVASAAAASFARVSSESERGCSSSEEDAERNDDAGHKRGRDD
jgi:hypothetical protein